MFRRWAPLQIANTMGLILNKTSGKTSGLTPEELNAVYECLTWGREEGNNKVLAFFGTVFESYDAARKVDAEIQERNARRLPKSEDPCNTA